MSLNTARLLGATALVGAFELLVLRVLTRTAIHIPGLTAFAAPYAVVASAGRFAYYLAAVLLCVLLSALAWQLVHRGPRGLAAAGCIALFALDAALARLGAIGGDTLDLVAVVSVVGVSVAAVLISPQGVKVIRRSAVALFASAFVLASATAPLALGEALFVLWCALSPLAAGIRPDRRSAAIGAAVTVFTFVALRAAESTVKVLLLWNLGLVGYLPDAAYAVALGLLALTLAGLARSRSPFAAPFTLLVVGGIGLHSTYQTGMVLAGLAGLALAAEDAPVPLETAPRLRARAVTP